MPACKVFYHYQLERKRAACSLLPEFSEHGGGSTPDTRPHMNRTVYRMHSSIPALTHRETTWLQTKPVEWVTREWEVERARERGRQRRRKRDGNGMMTLPRELIASPAPCPVSTLGFSNAGRPPETGMDPVRRREDAVLILQGFPHVSGSGE